MLMMVVLTLVLRAQTTQQSGIADTASADTLEQAVQNTQGQSEMAPPGTTQPSAADAVRSARESSEVSWTGRLISLLGMFVMLGIGYLFSVNRKAVQWNVVAWGTALQLIFALI